VTWCCGTIVDLVCVRDFGDRTVRNAPRIEMNGDREKVFSLKGFANQRAYVSDQSYLRYQNYFCHNRLFFLLFILKLMLEVRDSVETRAIMALG